MSTTVRTEQLDDPRAGGTGPWPVLLVLGSLAAVSPVSTTCTCRAAAKAFTPMLTVGGVAPALAPVVGGLLAGPIGWRGLLGRPVSRARPRAR